MQVWLAPVEGTRLLVPLTDLGAHDDRHERRRGLALVAVGDGQGRPDLGRAIKAGAAQ